MENIAFVIWMLGFPLVVIIDRYVGYLMKTPESSNDIKLTSAIIGIILYVGVAASLFDK